METTDPLGSPLAELTPATFKQSLSQALADETDQDIRAELHAAIERLERDPSLLVGTDEGDFTYSDPVLAQALYGVRLYLSGGPKASKAGKDDGADLSGSPRTWGQWARVGVGIFRHRKDPSFLSLAARSPQIAVTFDKEHLRLAVVGDAGYRGKPQNRVLQLILKRHWEVPFDVLIHLGDVYFAAGPGEMLRHFLGPFSKTQSAGMNLYTLAGNHDLYYGSEAYEHALAVLHQPGRYFAIKAPQWQIACLDTSLFDRSMGRHAGRLDEQQLAWLEDLLTDRARRTILMSHHYFVSAWKPGGDPLREQLENVIKERVLAWYWGHEHGCATYDRGVHGFFGACIGNGAFREPWNPPAIVRPGSPSWWAEGRCQCFGLGGRHYWSHGFLELDLGPEGIEETYHLEDGPELLHRRTLGRDS